MKNRGFTLTEVLIVVALFGILAFFTTGVDSGAIRRTNVISERNTLVELLVHARNQSMNNENQARHGVYVGANDFVLFEGDSYASAVNTEATPRDTGITFSGDQEVVFERLSGKVNSTANMTLSSSAKTTAVDINSEGRINW